MNIVITGGSGFIGRHLATHLRGEGHAVRLVSLRTPPPPDAFTSCDAVVHLSGEPVAQRWTPAARDRILKSRVEGTRTLVQAIRQFPQPPATLVSASAIGYYGSQGDEILTEASPLGQDFLGQTCAAWEQEARAAESLGVRVVTPRIGIVLGSGGGALARMALPFHLGLGGRLGSGRQWMSWIHIADLVALFAFAIAHQPLRGAVNAVAPHPVINADFTQELARAVHRPALLSVPELALKLLLGEMSQMILGSQRVLPAAALGAGFQFRFPELGPALKDIFAA